MNDKPGRQFWGGWSPVTIKRDSGHCFDSGAVLEEGIA